METLECLGKMPLSLSRECTPSNVCSVTNILWSITGLILTAHEILVETVISILVLISCGTLLHATFDIESTEGHQLENRFSHVTDADRTSITKMAEDLSKFIGEVLTAYLILNATISATALVNAFGGAIVVIISGILNNGVVLVGLFLASVAALRVHMTI